MYISIQERSNMNAQLVEKETAIDQAFAEPKWFDSSIRYGDPDFLLKYYYGAETKTNTDLVSIADDGNPIVFIHIPDYKFDKSVNRYVYDHTYTSTDSSKHKVERLEALLQDRVKSEVYGVFALVRLDSIFEESPVREIRPTPRPLRVDKVEKGGNGSLRVVLSASPMPSVDF